MQHGTEVGDTSAFLRLLADDASESAFTRVLTECKASAVTQAEQDALDDEFRLAMQVRQTLDRHRKRELELRALYETAIDLTSVLEVDGALRAIVRRARQLLGTDATYLTLIDHARGDTFMRVTEGIATEEFRNIRLEMGDGLGGLVAHTATPYSTLNYFKDSRFRRSHLVDSSVAEEGLKAIVGVPLNVRGEVIGVLFAANRHERPFTNAEVALLSSLAAHAAIALYNARLFQESQEALRELDEATEVIRIRSAELERASTLHQHLTDLVLEGADIQELAAAMSRILEGSIAILSAGGVPLASASAAPPQLQDLLTWLRDSDGEALVRETLQHGRTTAVGDDANTWISSIVAGGATLGAVVLRSTSDVGEPELRRLERACQVTAILLLNQRLSASAEHRARGNLIRDLLEMPSSRRPLLAERARLLGANLLQPLAVVVCATVSSDEYQLASSLHTLAAEQSGIAGEYGGYPVVVLPATDRGGAAQFVARRLERLLPDPVTIGAAEASGIDGLSDAHANAVRCLTALRLLGREGECANFEDLGVIALLLGPGDRSQLERHVERTLGPIHRYDTARGTALMDTLETLLRFDGNVTLTAVELHVHPNTVYQRLARIRDLALWDWNDAEERLNVALALKMRHLLPAL